MRALVVVGLAVTSGHAWATPIVNGEHDARTGVVLVAAGKVCTGVYVGAGLVLTAAHCINLNAKNASVNFSDGAGMKAFATSTNVAIHPNYNGDPSTDPSTDLAVINLDRCDVPDWVVPIPMLDAEMPLHTVNDLGATVTIVGFGETAPGQTSPDRLTGTAKIEAIEPGYVVLEPSPSIACEGDSGGPMLIEREGQTFVAAITSTGNCTTTGSYTRIEVGENANFVGTAAAVAIANSTHSCDPDCQRCGVTAPSETLPMLSAVLFVLRPRRRSWRPT